MPSSAIVFSYDSQSDVEYYIKNFEKMGLESMIICTEGDMDLSRVENLIQGKSVELVFNRERLGKSAAYNNAMKLASSDIVFLISGDVRFDPHEINIMEESMKDDEIIIPRVVPFETGSRAGRIASFMWNLRDTCLDSDDWGYPKSGGEFQALPSKCLVIIPNVINDDEYICLNAHSNGMRVVYRRDLVVRNWVPETFRELLIQRVRINYGHLEMKKYFEKSASLSLNFIRNIRKSFRIMKKHFLRYPEDIRYILPAFALELTSIVYAYFDLKRSRNHLLWRMVSTSHDPGNSPDLNSSFFSRP
ncbi:glycosyltransferase [Oxyplasma meridianum]|uniref:Glycosyltransferase n=1 Tax=Oxyplasma meridianum TaxID=3073602 RepID=A0AAX4NIF7_9ARCH